MKYIFNDKVLIISDKAYEGLKEQLQNSYDNQRGGVIIGKKIKDQEIYEVTHFTHPTEQDVSSRFEFKRSYLSANHYIKKYYDESDGIENYIGEWHTHPEPMPIPCRVDRASMEQVGRNEFLSFKSLFLIIAGSTGKVSVSVIDIAAPGKLEKMEIKEDSDVKI